MMQDVDFCEGREEGHDDHQKNAGTMADCSPYDKFYNAYGEL
jgi:hypothetical protein